MNITLGGESKWLKKLIAALITVALGGTIFTLVNMQSIEQNRESNANAQENNGTLKNHTQNIGENNGVAVNGDVLITPTKPVRQLENETDIKRQIDNALNDYSKNGYGKHQVQVEVKHIQGDEEGS